MSLFELKAKYLVPPIGSGKSLKANAIAEDGFDYAAKTLADHPLLPATEWFCYHLARSVSLACPNYAVLVMQDGTRAFGSRIEVGLSSMEEEVANGFDPADYLDGCADRMSIAYAMDLFLGNTDRHFGNFLFRKNSMGHRTAMPIDYSHAWWVGGWPPADLTVKTCTTTYHIEILRAMGLWKASHALMALGSISQIRIDTALQWMQNAPKEWMPEATNQSMMAWWGSNDFHARLSNCVAHCKP